jgi:hypothetical protein
MVSRIIRFHFCLAEVFKSDTRLLAVLVPHHLHCPPLTLTPLSQISCTTPEWPYLELTQSYSSSHLPPSYLYSGCWLLSVLPMKVAAYSHSLCASNAHVGYDRVAGVYGQVIVKHMVICVSLLVATRILHTVLEYD